MKFSYELKNKLIDFGATFVGFSDVEGKLPNELKALKYAITVGIRLSDAIINQIDHKPTFTYFHHYKTVNTLLDQLALKGLLYIQEKGFNAFTIPASQTVNDVDDNYSGVFPHKTAAVLSGLGWIGKNGLFISREYGPRVRLGTILTDMELPLNNFSTESKCGKCNICVSSCPTMALTGGEWYKGCERADIVDAKACSDYMNKEFKHIGRGSVCGICIKVCPIGIDRGKIN